MVIYTRKGDKGKTSLYGGPARNQRVSKSDARVVALGSIDEANSFLGVVSGFLTDRRTFRRIERVQINLLQIGSILAGANLSFGLAKVKYLEAEIDRMDKILPNLVNFIIPGGQTSSSLLHFARSLVRRAERDATRVIAEGETQVNKKNCLKYLNRLSDYLFTLARLENFKLDLPDRPWKNSS